MGSGSTSDFQPILRTHLLAKPGQAWGFGTLILRDSLWKTFVASWINHKQPLPAVDLWSVVVLNARKTSSADSGENPSETKSAVNTGAGGIAASPPTNT